MVAEVVPNPVGSKSILFTLPAIRKPCCIASCLAMAVLPKRMIHPCSQPPELEQLVPFAEAQRLTDAFRLNASERAWFTLAIKSFVYDESLLFKAIFLKEGTPIPRSTAIMVNTTISSISVTPTTLLRRLFWLNEARGRVPVLRLDIIFESASTHDLLA